MGNSNSKISFKRLHYVARAFEVAKDCSKKCDTPYFKLLKDIVDCSTKYGAGPTDYLAFRFYELSEEERNTYLTRLRSATFVKSVNSRAVAPIFNDKNTFAEQFSDMIGRKTLNLKTAKKYEFLDFIEGKKFLILKPSSLDSGQGIEKIAIDNFVNVNECYDYCMNPEKDFGIAEEVLKQHKDMAALNESSVNCVRIATFVKDKNTVELIYGACKAGAFGGPCDNTGRGGITCRLDLETGQICSHGHTEDYTEYKVHPNSGITFKGYQVPMYDKVVKLAKKAALRFPEFRYVGWDICITPSGPVLVEGNDYPGYDLAQIPDSDAPHPRKGLVPCFEKLGIKI